MTTLTATTALVDVGVAAAGHRNALSNFSKSSSLSSSPSSAIQQPIISGNIHFNAFTGLSRCMKQLLFCKSVRTWGSVRVYCVAGGRIRTRAVAAGVAESLVGEEEATEQEQAGEGTVGLPRLKPKTGKAALPLKSDRRRSKRFLEIQKLRVKKRGV